MSFEFAIRDDDVNHFTRPEEVENAYADLPDEIPVSLAVVPYQGGTETPAIPRSHWDSDEEFPLGENSNLVKYLRRGVKSGRFGIMQHGYDHVKRSDGPEFVAAKNPDERIHKGRDHLEEVLDVDIEIFVPPNNSYSEKSLKLVKKAGLHTFYYPTPFNRPNSWDVLSTVAEDLYFKYRHKTGGPAKFAKDAYRFWQRGDRSVFMPVRPVPYTLQGGQEVNAVTLTRSGDPGKVKRQMEIADRYNGVFCLAVHYHSFKSKEFRERFYNLIDYAKTELDPEFVRARELFD